MSANTGFELFFAQLPQPEPGHRSRRPLVVDSHPPTAPQLTGSIPTCSSVKNRDQSRHHRLGRDHGRRSARGDAAGRVAVRAARRREPDAHRAPVAEALPLAPRHARRAVHDAHPRRHRHGPVGHHRQALGRAGLSAARRPERATESASIPRRKAHEGAAARQLEHAARPAEIERMVDAIQRSAASGSARTARSCSTPTAPCRRRCSSSSPPPSSRTTCCSSRSRPCRATSRCSSGSSSRSASRWRPASATAPSGR